MPRSYTPPGGHQGSIGGSSPGAGGGDARLRQVDLIFVMDATGSMQSYIDAARKELKAFAQQLATHSMRPRMAYGLVLYRDHPPEDSSFVTQSTPLSESLEVVQQALDRARADGGGDGPEAVVDGLYDAVYRMQWRKGSHKVVLLAGDAPPHGCGGSGDGFADGCPCRHDPVTVAQQAYEKGISIFALGIGGDSTMKRSFENIAKNAGGKYVALGSAHALINEVLSITVAEFGKVDVDLVVYAAYRPGITVAALAAATGLSQAEVTASLERLRKKEMISR